MYTERTEAQNLKCGFNILCILNEVANVAGYVRFELTKHIGYSYLQILMCPHPAFVNTPIHKQQLRIAAFSECREMEYKDRSLFIEIYLSLVSLAHFKIFTLF